MPRKRTKQRAGLCPQPDAPKAEQPRRSQAHDRHAQGSVRAPRVRAPAPYRIVRTYRSNLERCVAALSLVLAIPTPESDPPTPPAASKALCHNSKEAA
jgi:hypothetical protein